MLPQLPVKTMAPKNYPLYASTTKLFMAIVYVHLDIVENEIFPTGLAYPAIPCVLTCYPSKPPNIFIPNKVLNAPLISL